LPAIQPKRKTPPPARNHLIILDHPCVSQLFTFLPQFHDLRFQLYIALLEIVPVGGNGDDIF
jgi:hypothetical protein